MELKFMQNSASQKISALEKELKALKETLKAASVALGTKLLSVSENATPQNYVSEELLSTWKNCVEERKTCTENILSIKNILEHKEHSEKLIQETKKMINAKDKEIQKLKDAFALSVYQNHREEFAQAVERLPEISKLEEHIANERTKIDGLSSEKSQKGGFFDKLMPSVKTLVAKRKMSSAENKLKKLVQEQSGQLFSDEDFENLYAMADELPPDLQTHISSLKVAVESREAALSKKAELENDAKTADEKLTSLDALTDSKKQIKTLMQQIDKLDAKIENTALCCCENYVNRFFSTDGDNVDAEQSDSAYKNAIDEIGQLRRKCVNADIFLEVAKCESEIELLNGKIKHNINRIDNNKAQIARLTNEIDTNEQANEELQLSISDFNAKIDALKQKCKEE